MIGEEQANKDWCMQLEHPNTLICKYRSHSLIHFALILIFYFLLDFIRLQLASSESN